MKAIANILREVADKIAALEFPTTLAASEPALPEPPKPSPLAGLVSPIGFHKAIMGPLKVKAPYGSKDVSMFENGSWASGFEGVRVLPYALRIGSEIAKLNGLEPEAIPADKDPEQDDSDDPEYQRCSPAEPAKERADASWTIKVSDSFVEYEFKIKGRGDTSIEEVANNAAEFLKGSIQSSGQTRKYSDPKPDMATDALIAELNKTEVKP